MIALPACPDPLARAPRAPRASMPSGGARADWLRLGPPALQGALVALVGRDTRAVTLADAQRLTHFPASPMISITWTHDTPVGMIARTADGPLWTPFGARMMVGGSQSDPTTSWAQATGHGVIACFAADAAQALFDLDLGAIQDRFVPAADAIGPQWQPLWDELLATAGSGTGNDAGADVVAVFERHLASRWQALRGRTTAQPSLRQLGRHWVERLGMRAQEWSRLHGPRHVERRVKAFSGRSLREWQALVRTEGLFFAARDRHAAGIPFDWAGLAQDEGFADQAHMSRVAKRITGFSPTDFAQRFVDDESFWLYRLWV